MSSVVELGVLSQHSMVQVLAAHMRGPGWALHPVCVAVGKSFSWANCGNLTCPAPRRGVDWEHGRSTMPQIPWDQNTCSRSASHSLCCGKPPGEPKKVSVLAWSLCLPGCKSWNINWKLMKNLNVRNCTWLELNHDVVQLMDFSFVVMFWWFVFYIFTVCYCEFLCSNTTDS